MTSESLSTLVRNAYRHPQESALSTVVCGFEHLYYFFKCPQFPSFELRKVYIKMLKKTRFRGLKLFENV